MNRLSETLYSWASILEPNTEAQARALSELPIIHGHVALMPDAHLGIGSTVGSVIPTRGAVIPAAIGVDIGCGMIAACTGVKRWEAETVAADFVAALRTIVPAGLGEWHAEPKPEAETWFAKATQRFATAARLASAGTEVKRLLQQLGTMGSGNHFFELAADGEDDVWVLMHSGSRGIGNKLAQRHILEARRACPWEESRFTGLRGVADDKNLAWLVEGTFEFDAYVDAMCFAQAYALENRRLMMDAAIAWFLARFEGAEEVDRINCHHNFTQREGAVWVTRKGAIRAGAGDRGLIPGAMGGRSYVVRGLGNADSYESAPHGAGRVMSRSKARKTFTIESLAEVMSGSAWQSGEGKKLLDEHPGSYKPIDVVMNDSRDLVAVEHELTAFANYKGTS